jgi:8-oxo-dGTP pyrophosphatase MutT (NUDIX family)/predicted kinase
VFVVVSGPPASGKSTLAPALARELGLPLVAKDTIKDAFMSVLPVPDLEASRRLGRAAVVAMLAVAGESPVGAVIESNFRRSVAAAGLAGLPGPVVEVFCRVDRETAARRYAARAGSRHPGHFDAVRSPEELWNDEVARPVAGGWPVLDADTAAPVDVPALAARVRASLAPPVSPRWPVSVKGIVCWDDRVVLLHNARGEWELPGGRLEPGETPERCVEREIHEELGLVVRAERAVDTWVYEVLPGRAVLIVTYGCAAARPDGPDGLVVSDEHDGVGLFPVAELDALPLPEGYRTSIRRWHGVLDGGRPGGSG